MRLGVNVDHVATLRQARIAAGQYIPGSSVYPDPILAAKICQKLGAHSIVMHLREDRRHIQDQDLFLAKECLSIQLNMEMSIAPSVLSVALRLRPHQVTIVPEKRQERTTESGLNLFANEKALRSALEALGKKRIGVSLFIDPEDRQVKKAAALGVEAIELHTGTYAEAPSRKAVQKEWQRLKEATELGRSLGLLVHAGHGLDYKNLKKIKKIQGLDELNIGYSIVSRALWVGWEKAVSEMLKLVRS